MLKEIDFMMTGPNKTYYLSNFMRKGMLKVVRGADTSSILMFITVRLAGQHRKIPSVSRVFTNAKCDSTHVLAPPEQ